MPRFVITCSLLLGTIFGQGSSVAGENWPGWRGPRGDGSSFEKHVPIKWDGTSEKNIHWKVEVPGVGHASPIVWEDRLFVVSCLQGSENQSKERMLICLDRRSGKTLWQKTVIKSALETKHSLNSFASGTPATDGKLVYVTFLEIDGSKIPARNVSRRRPVTPGKIAVAAYDLDGNQKWIVRPGNFVSVHGFCSSPVIYKNLLIVNGDHDGDSYIVALNKETGETVWKTKRRYKTRSYVTPLIRKIGGRTQMVLSGSKCIISIDPANGSRYWSIEGPTEQYVASMVYDGSQFYMAAGFPTHHVMAIRPDGTGDVTKSHVSWHSKEVKCYVPSPIVLGKHLLVADDRGTANCYSTKTGERLWQGRLGRHYSASLISAGGLVYFLADDGVTKIVKPGKELKVVAENKLGEFCYASPAISRGQIFLRGVKHLFCIGTEAILSE